MDWRTGDVEVRRSRRLVISFFTTVANYEYGTLRLTCFFCFLSIFLFTPFFLLFPPSPSLSLLFPLLGFFYYLYLDGTIQFEIKLTGIINTGHVASGSLPPRYGSIVGTEGLYGLTHQHFFCYRLDMSVDSHSNNSVYEINTQSVPISEENPQGNAFYARLAFVLFLPLSVTLTLSLIHSLFTCTCTHTLSRSQNIYLFLQSVLPFLGQRRKRKGIWNPLLQDVGRLKIQLKSTLSLRNLSLMSWVGLSSSLFSHWLTPPSFFLPAFHHFHILLLFRPWKQLSSFRSPFECFDQKGRLPSSSPPRYSLSP
jgi:hypothetical protein